MRILHIITTLDCGGAEAMLVKLVQAMAAGDGTRSTVVSLMGPGIYGAVLSQSGVPVHCLGMRRGVPTPGAVLRLVRILRREKPDVVQTWMYHADLIGTLAARLGGVGPVCWNIRCSDMDLSQYSRLTRWLVALLARLSTLPAAILVNSQAGLRAHQALGYQPRAWCVIPNGFDAERFRPDRLVRQQVRQELGLSEEALVIGMVARFDPMKDHATFLAAAAILAQRHPGLRFILVGKDVTPDNPAFADTDTAGGALAGRLRLLGQRGDVHRLLPALDVVCLSSAFGEGFPNVLGEAMACAVPCVATDVGDAAWLLAGTGLTVPPRQPQAFADAVDHLLSLPAEERLRLGQAARQRILDGLTVSAVAGQYGDVYARLA